MGHIDDTRLRKGRSEPALRDCAGLSYACRADGVGYGHVVNRVSGYGNVRNQRLNLLRPVRSAENASVEGRSEGGCGRSGSSHGGRGGRLVEGDDCPRGGCRAAHEVSVRLVSDKGITDGLCLSLGRYGLVLLADLEELAGKVCLLRAELLSLLSKGLGGYAVGLKIGKALADFVEAGHDFIDVRHDSLLL